MNVPKRHHYIPQFYLTRFADLKPQVTVIPRKAGKRYTTAVKNVAVESQLYTITDDSGARSLTVEKKLAEIEGQAKRVMGQIDRGDFPPTGEDREWLAIFIALLLTRTPEFRHTMEATAVLDKQLLASMRSREYVRSLLSARRGREPTEAEIDESLRGIENDGDPSPSANDLIGMMLRLAIRDMAPIIIGMAWYLLKTPHRELLTSDHPVVYWREPRPENRHLGVGLTTADCAYFPLDPSTALMLTPRDYGPPYRRQIGDAEARHINALIAFGCYDYLYCHPRHHDPLQGTTLYPRRSLLEVNGKPLYRGGEGIEAIVSDFHAPFDERGDRFAIVEAGGGHTGRGRRVRRGGNPALGRLAERQRGEFLASPLYHAGDGLRFVIGDGPRVVFIFRRDSTYWGMAHERATDAWEDLGVQSERDVRKMRGR